MRRVVYPQGTAFIDNYKKLFHTKISSMKAEWNTLRVRFSLYYLPTDIEDILTANIDDLTQWYVRFKKLDKKQRKAINKGLEKLFDYEVWRDSIAEYFMNPDNGFHLRSCHYCDTAYINAYKIDPDSEALFFLNVASDEELERITTSDKRKKDIKDTRQFEKKDQFEVLVNKYKWKPTKWEDTFETDKKQKNHFDLDHFLPKGQCVFVALSLFNFVPSCPICNERLKKLRVLGNFGIPNAKLSPTSSSYDFDGNAQFVVVPSSDKIGGLLPTQVPEDYDLELNTWNDDFKYFIRLFKLEERYRYHKQTALHWMEMKMKYSDNRIRMMEESLSDKTLFSFKKIKSDIFQEELYKDENMCFSKVRKDMLR